MIIIYFFYGMAFSGLGLAALLQLRRGGDFPLRQQLPWLAAFGFAAGATGWVDMFLVSGIEESYLNFFTILRIFLQPIAGLLLLVFGWGILRSLTPLPAWTLAIPGLLIVPFAFVITYASTTFVTPSPIEIPVDIWSRYLLYLPGSFLAGLGFLRQWHVQRRLGYHDVSNLMLGAGLAFLLEAFVVGLVVPAAPYGPASYYNYDRVAHNAFAGEFIQSQEPYGLSNWLDYDRVLATTGLPIQFWRMLSALAVTFFVVRGLDVFDTIRRRHLRALQEERDRARQAAFDAQITARQTAETWTDTLVSINRRIAELDDVDRILIYIVENARQLLDANFCGLGIVSDDEHHLELRCYSDLHKTLIPDNPQLVEHPAILSAMHATQARLLDQEQTASPGGIHLAQQDAPVFSAAIVPLVLDNQPIGALWLTRADPPPFSETDLIWLECMADQIVIAMQHGSMTAQLQSLSIVEERGRIAREMHDGLAQVLGYLNLQVQTLDTLLKRGKLESLEDELGQMRQAVKLAHADVRENILSLRTTLAHEKGLTSAIDEYLAEFGIQTSIETELVNQVRGNFQLSSLAEVQLVCILQEALANVRKHARASRVQVVLGCAGQPPEMWITLRIQDDGQGFSQVNSRRNFGLKIMHERAESVGGTLHIQASPGQGTLVECALPCLSQEALTKPTVLRNGSPVANPLGMKVMEADERP